MNKSLPNINWCYYPDDDVDNDDDMEEKIMYFGCLVTLTTYILLKEPLTGGWEKTLDFYYLLFNFWVKLKYMDFRGDYLLYLLKNYGYIYI